MALMFAFISFLLQTPVFSATCYANLPKAQFQNCQLVTPSYALHWSVNASIIVFGVDIDVPSISNSWIGLGLSQMGGMYGADIFLLRQNSSGSWYIQDSFATTTGIPTSDDQQDVFLLAGPAPSNTSTVFTFYRAIRTCDSMDYEVLQGRQQHMIWAFGPPQSAKTLDYHGTSNRGNFILTLYPNAATSPAALSQKQALKEIKQLNTTSSLKVFEARFPNITVPSAQTSYLCTHLQVPSDQKYHVVQYEGIVTSDVVHHMIMYGCAFPPAKFGDVYDCANMEATCTQFTMAWVPGLGQVVYPSAAGFAIGSGAIRYFSLQIHYNNQKMQSGIVDSSGMRLYYTSQLRPNDIGVLRLGNEDLTIPGSSTSYTSTTWNVCPSACTKKFPGNLTVISNGFHMHTLGYNVSTRQIRGTQEIQPLGVRQYYNFFYQGESAPLDNNAIISPGDTLLTQCNYLPTYGVRTNTTRYGESTKDEMCYNFVTYYPSMPLISVCMDIGNGYPYAVCASDAELASANSTTQMLTNGWLLQFPPLNFTRYIPPVCQATLQKQGNASGIPSAGGVSVLSTSAGFKLLPLRWLLILLSFM